MKHWKTQAEARMVYANTFMQKVLDLQPDLEKIFYDAMSTSPEREIHIVKYHSDDSTTGEEVVERACMRRGYKIVYTPKTGIYELLRCNTSDYYKHAPKSEVKDFVKLGWLRAVDERQLKRDRKRLAKFNRKIDNANEQRNDSLMVHWRKRRRELIDNISSIEEKMNSENYGKQC